MKIQGYFRVGYQACFAGYGGSARHSRYSLPGGCSENGQGFFPVGDGPAELAELPVIAAEFLLQYYNGSSWVTISDLGSTASEDQWLHYQEKVTDSQFFSSTFKVRWSAVDVEGGEELPLTVDDDFSWRLSGNGQEGLH